MGVTRHKLAEKAPKLLMHVGFGVISLTLVAAVLYFVLKESVQGAYGLAMCSSLVFWTLPKFVCDIWRHFADAADIYTSLTSEMIVLLEGGSAFETVSKFLTGIDTGNCINGVAIERHDTWTAYDIFAFRFTVYFVFPLKGLRPHFQGFAFPDGTMVAERPFFAWRCDVIEISFSKEGDWSRAADGQYVKKLSQLQITSTSRTKNIKFLEYCSSMFFATSEQLPSTRPRTLSDPPAPAAPAGEDNDVATLQQPLISPEDSGDSW